MLGQALHHIIAGFVRRTWLVASVAVLVCAVCAAHTVASLIDAQVPEAAPTSRNAPLEKPPVPAQTRPERDGNAFVERNMFCSSCTPAVATGGSGPTDNFVPDALLIATSVGEDPRATLLVRANQAQGSWGTGEKVPGLGTLVRVGYTSVDLVDDAGRKGRLSLLEQPAGGRGETGAATPGPTAAADPADPFADRLRKIDDQTFEVDRSLVRELVGGSMTKAGARISPLTNKNGQLDGLKVVGVRPSGLASRLGLQNGDVLEGVNNTKIESANTLLGLYAQLETLNTVELEGTRRGKPLTLTLRLR